MDLIDSGRVEFSFGRNWKEFLPTIDDNAIKEAGKDIDQWLGSQNIQGKSVIDIGSGSGLSSLCIYYRGCRRLVSFDSDPESVETAKFLAARAGSPDNWAIFQGSIIDETLINRLGTFEIVHSWGVLHHTGKMWQAMAHAIRLCAPGALFLISIYAAGDRYEEHLALKRRFNAADPGTKADMIRIQMERTKSFYRDNENSEGGLNRDRGMTHYHDAVDWLGGLPYEVAHASEVLLFCINRGLVPLRVFERRQGGCSVYLFRNDPNRCSATRRTFQWGAEWSVGQVERNLESQLTEELARLCNTAGNQRAQMGSLKGNIRRSMDIIRRRFRGECTL